MHAAATAKVQRAVSTVRQHERRVGVQVVEDGWQCGEGWEVSEVKMLTALLGYNFVVSNQQGSVSVREALPPEICRPSRIKDEELPAGREQKSMNESVHSTNRARRLVEIAVPDPGTPGSPGSSGFQHWNAGQYVPAEEFLAKCPYHTFFGNLFSPEEASALVKAVRSAGATAVDIKIHAKPEFRHNLWQVSEDEVRIEVTRGTHQRVLEAVVAQLGVHWGHSWEDVLGDCSAWWSSADNKAISQDWETFHTQIPEGARYLSLWFD